MASVTDLRHRYTSDVFFRTTLIITALEIGLFFFLMGFFAMGVALALIGFSWVSAGLIAIAGMALITFFGIVLSRLALRPARMSLESQKLFISNIAHELRTPLAVIKTTAEVEMLDDKLPEASRKTLEAVLEEVSRASGVINNLISLNRLVRPQKMERAAVDLGAIIDRVVARSGRVAFERGIEVQVRRNHHTMVTGNPVALEQMVINLTNNAIQYTPKNGRGKVTLTLRPESGNRLMFSVSDNGIGIAKEDLAHILEPYYRGDKSRARNIKEAGSGLGLAIVNEIVEAHGGELRVNSIQGKGTNVTVLLPAARQRPQAAQ